MRWGWCEKAYWEQISISFSGSPMSQKALVCRVMLTNWVSVIMQKWYLISHEKEIWENCVKWAKPSGQVSGCYGNSKVTCSHHNQQQHLSKIKNRWKTFILHRIASLRVENISWWPYAVSIHNWQVDSNSSLIYKPMFMMITNVVQFNNNTTFCLAPYRLIWTILYVLEQKG